MPPTDSKRNLPTTYDVSEVIKQLIIIAKNTSVNDYFLILAAQAASKSLLDAIGDIYESQWSGHDLLFAQIQSIDMLWQDFSHKLADQVLLPLNTYQSQFPEMRVSFNFPKKKFLVLIFICFFIAEKD